MLRFRTSSPLFMWLLLVGMLVAAGPAAAQQPEQDQVAKFRLAQNYMRAGQFDRAITVLEDLYSESPSTQVFYDKLKEAYENVKRYDEAIALVDEHLDADRNPVLMSERARLLYLKGDDEEALQTWDRAIALAPDRASTYRLVYHSLAENRLFEKAIEVLEAGREVLEDPTAFQSDLAQLYSLTGAHEQAMDEYLAWLRTDENKLNLIRSRLSRFTEQEEARRAYLTAARRAVREHPLYRPYRELLAWLHMESGQYADALDDMRAIDRLEQEQGRVLFDFARQVAHAGAYNVALEAYQEILDRYPNSPVAPQARLGLGMMHERWAEQIGERAVGGDGRRLDAPHYERARASYRTFLKQYPNAAPYPDVLRRLGRLQQDVFNELDEAESTLQEVLRRFPDSDAAQLARYDLGRVALMRGELRDARLAFSRLEEELRIGELAEQTRYELALLHFYQGEFESALTLAEVLNTNTSTDVANDAIELKVLINENKGPDSLNTPLKIFARARLLQRQHHQKKALATVDTLLQRFGQHPIADDTRFLRAEVLHDAGQVEDALTAYLELPMIHPRSPLADRSLFRAAEIQERDLDDPEAALKTYTRLLTEHPGSLLIPDVRARIRTLRGDGV